VSINSIAEILGLEVTILELFDNGLTMKEIASHLPEMPLADIARFIAHIRREQAKGDILASLV
jgi:hypothetical protein